MNNPIKFYTDEHVPQAVIKRLRQEGIEVLTTPEAGMMSASDQAQLVKAFQESRVIFTQDDDFLRLPATGANHAGIVYARQHLPIGQMIRGLKLIYQVLEASEMEGRVEFL